MGLRRSGGSIFRRYPDRASSPDEREDDLGAARGIIVTLLLEAVVAVLVIAACQIAKL